MVHIGTAEIIDRPWATATPSNRPVPAQHSVLIVRDADQNSDYLDSVCEFLDIGVEHATTTDDLGSILAMLNPMALITDLTGEVQDGFHVMKMVAGHDRSLPVLLLTSNDPALLGAVDAVQEVWGLRRVTTVSPAAGIGALVDFICRAARSAGRSRLMRV